MRHGYVEFKDVSFRYPGAEENVVENISFLARRDRRRRLSARPVPASPPLWNLVPRFFDVTAGSIEVDGVDIREVSQQELRHKIGYVPQKGVLFSGTIESNLRYADQEADWHQLKQAAEIAQAREFIDAKPEGLTRRSPRAAPTCPAVRSAAAFDRPRACPQSGNLYF